MSDNVEKSFETDIQTYIVEKVRKSTKEVYCLRRPTESF